MESVGAVQAVGSNNVQVEVVTHDGHPVTPHPIRVEELLQQQDHTLDVGNGIALRLEELNAEQNYSDDDDDTDATSSSAGSSARDIAETVEREETDRAAVSATRQGRHAGSPPPGTLATSDWYDVLDALRREQQDVERTTAAVEGSRRVPQEGEGRLVTRNPNDQRSVATPLKRFSNVPSTATRSIAGDRSSASPPPPPGASRHAVWASLAPAKDVEPHNYNVLRYVSYMGALDCRRFRPTALAFHATAAYLSRKDCGQRFLVYGGLSVGARKVEQELYEFSVLTGNWRRIEGKQLVPAGHYAHTMTVVESVDRLVVVGGIGPGGDAVSAATRKAWADDPLRSPRLQFLCPLLRRGGLLGGSSGSGVAAATLGIGAAPRAPTQVAAAIGFVPLLFDMSLSDLTWRAIQPAQAFPLAYHTAVHLGKEIFIFGGLTDELRVSGQLLALHPETYAVRLVTAIGSAAGSSARSRRGRSGSTKASTDDAAAGSTTGTAAAAVASDEEAAGPGPRFLHTAVCYGPYMIVYGGYNAHNEPLSDCWAFDTMNERWERLPCRGEVPARAGHECCVVGCRMIVAGGFECSLDEAGSAAAAPAATVVELNLVPTPQGEHLWRSAVKLHPPLPPLAFTRCAPCGDDHSFILFGGLTPPPPSRRGRSRSKSAGRRDGSATRNHSEDDESDDAANAQQQQEAHKEAGRTHSSAASQASHKGLLTRLAPFDDGLVFTFPVRQRRRHDAAGAPAVNALGVEVDPNELPEHFKTFVRRQEDFVKKRDAAAEDTVRKITLEEQEGMEPALYLTDEEIELLLQRSEDCCVAFAQRYPMTSLPSNVPDREERVRLVEECVSMSRQVRDVMKSMKGSAPGVTAVKSKSHRKRAGQKFEDYSAAKPFRRVVVAHLLEGINSQLALMHRLNRALRTVDWEEKATFLAAVDDMQSSVHAVSQAINHVMRRYIQHRVDSLMKGVDRHKEVMRQLTQVVEKNRHDKIWGIEAARDAQRQQKDQKAKASPRGQAASPKRVSRSVSAAAGAPPARTRSRSLGGGYHADEAKAVVHLMDREWTQLLARTQAVEKCAGQLQRYCLDAVTAAHNTVPPAQPPSAAPALPLPPPSLPTGLPLPTPSLPSAATATLQPLPTAPALPNAGEAGSARPRDIMIRHSNELREQTAAVAEEVSSAAAAFYAALTRTAASTAGGTSPSTTSSSSSPAASPSHENTAAAAAHEGGVPSQPAVTGFAVPPPAAQQAKATVSRSSSSASSSSSSSSTSSAVAAAPQNAAPAPQVPVVPPLGLPQPVTAGVPPSHSAAVGAPSAQTESAVVTAAIAHDGAANAERKVEDSKAKAKAGPTAAVVEGHAIQLSALRPLLAAKEALLARKGSVALIRKDEWDGNDLSGAPQDVRVEELYNRLERLVTAVGQSVTASFLSKAGARPPRVVRPASALSVVGPPARSASRKVKKPAGTEAGGPPSTAPQPHLSKAAATSIQQNTVPVEAKSNASGLQGSGGEPVASAEPLRLRPLPSAAGDEDWWKASHLAADGAARAKTAVDAAAAAAAAPPLVSAEALLRDVRLDSASASPTSAAAGLKIEPVFHDVRTVPNKDVSSGGAIPYCSGAGSGPWSLLPSSGAARHASSFSGAAAATANSVLSLSVVPKVVMPTPADDGDAEMRPWPAHGSSSPPALQSRRLSTIEELTQLPPTAAVRDGPAGSQGDNALARGLLSDTGIAAREPITSITGGNFAVNTEYLFRVAPQTMPRSHIDGSAHAIVTEAGVMDPTSVHAARHAWADVDDDYFYFGRPAENRVAPAEAVAGGPPYVTVSPTLATGRVGVSPPVGTVVVSSRLNAELTSADRPSSNSAAHRSSSGRRAEGSYRGTTASQTQKTQTARVVRKEGERVRNFYTPGELQLMQARERLRTKPTKQPKAA